MQCQNCNTDEMMKGTVPVVSQRDETVFLAYQVPAMVCPTCDFYVLEEAVKARVDEVMSEPPPKGAEVVTWRYWEEEEWEED